MQKSRQTKLIIDINKIKYNIQQIKYKIKDNVKIMPVIKANGYGTEIKKLIKIFDEVNINILSVAIVDEGIELRKFGFKGEIVILNQPLKEEISKIIKHDLITSVCSLEFVELLNKVAQKDNKIVNIHLEIETGMGRTGINFEEINYYMLKFKKLNNINLQGIFTHFSSSDYDKEYTEKQMNLFIEAKKIIEKNYNLKYIHCCNTAGIINFPEAHFNLVRPGIGIYGYLPNKCLNNKIQLQPATTLKSKISYIKIVKESTSIGYNQAYKTDKITTIATIPIGYADGIPRNFSKRGEIIIKNEKAQIVGNICMDSFMVDITHLKNIKIGEDVYIWDNYNTTLEEVAEKCDTINYEIMSRISPRVVRKFI